jgi:hypothetical protein
MSIEAGVVARLAAVSAITTLVGTRTYADILPDNTTHPAIVYQLISTIPFDSNLATDGGIFQSRVQFTCIADTKAVSISLSEALKTAFTRFTGTASDVTIIDSRLENILDQAYDLETGQTARIVDYMFYWN